MESPKTTILEQRIDKWLWHARIVKTRTLATKLAMGGRIRLNKVRVTKASQVVRVDDVIAVPQGSRVRLLQVCGFGERRGSADLAQGLYEDIAVAAETPCKAEQSSDDLTTQPAQRESGSGRPTKRDRRAMDKFLQS